MAKPADPNHLTRKLVVVGDGATGKTCLLLVFAIGKFPKYYVPTIFEHHLTDIIIDNRKITLELWDTAGQEEYSRLRPLSYPNTDIVLLCCSVDLPDSLENAHSIWLPEILQHCPRGVKVMLVCTKIDLRKDDNTLNNLSITDQIPLLTEQCQRVADEIGAAAFAECSARQYIGVDEVFHTATRLVTKGVQLKHRAKVVGKKNPSKCVIL